MQTTSGRAPSLVQSLSPVLVLIVLLASSVYLFGDGSAGGPSQIALILAAGAAIIVGISNGFTWRQLEAGIVHGISLSLGAVLILLVVGALIGTWILAGIVPTMIYYGLSLLSPSIFFAAACLICGFVSLATGSSWTTAGTIGVALIGIATAQGLPLGLAAGAVISGAYFGDKMSPLSDTTNLAPAAAGSELFEHVRHMAWTTGPSLAIALVLYWLLGLKYGGGQASTETVQAITDGLTKQFRITPWLLIPPVLVLVMVIRKVPALPAVFAGAIIGGIFAGVFQEVPFGRALEISYSGFKAETGVAAVDDLLTRGGMESMYGTIGIIICAMCFGGIMERSGMLGVIAGAILRVAKGTGGLITATLGTAMGINVIAPDQYLSIVVPGRMYREAYQKAGLHPKNLSRALEDAGTLTSPLVPWNSCGAYMYATLGVFPFAYLPYAFLNLINPLISALYGWTGWTIVRVPPEDHRPVV